MTNEHLNRLCALHVMKWIADDDCPLGYRPFWHTADADVEGPDYEEWQPSTRIEDAWKVLERFPWPQYRVLLMITESGNWRCDIHLRGGDGPAVSAFDKSVARAICVTCLKASGVEVAE